VQATFEKGKRFIPLILFVVFVSVTSVGTEWGLPEFWHPDELIKRVTWALDGNWEFDTQNFLYPSLPKYVMFWLGKAMYGWGYVQAEFVQAGRWFSVVLGGLLVAMTYKLARLAGGGLAAASFASLLLLTSGEMAQHARYAHNDIYVAFFSLLAVLALLRYAPQGHKGWLYASFALTGLAISSKFHVAGLLLAPTILYLQKNKDSPPPKRFGTLFAGWGLSFLAFGLGTPRALFSFGTYWNGAVSSLLTQAIYGRQPDTLIGFFGGWGRLWELLGPPVFVLVVSALAWHLRLAMRGGIKGARNQARNVLLLSLAALVLPLSLSYSYLARYFLPSLPLLFVMAGLLIEDLWDMLRKWGKHRIRWTVWAVAVVLIGYSTLRATAVLLLFQNDARIAASAYLPELQPSSRIEYTLYPPIIPKNHFRGGHNYPLVFIKVPDQQMPVSPLYEFNTGALGISRRQPDYLIIDSFTYARFENEYICQLHRLDCDFFTDLLNGETDYELLESFRYTLPTWFPSVETSFLNPDIRVYERK
jgi:hypothetical protein